MTSYRKYDVKLSCKISRVSLFLQERTCFLFK